MNDTFRNRLGRANTIINVSLINMYEGLLSLAVQSLLSERKKGLRILEQLPYQ